MPKKVRLSYKCLELKIFVSIYLNIFCKLFFAFINIKQGKQKGSILAKDLVRRYILEKASNKKKFMKIL
jgi:hypothetical protein